MGHSWKQNKKRNFLILISGVILIIIITIICFSVFKNKNTTANDIGLSIKGENYYLEIAQNNQTRKKGLSDRQELCSNCGMLFIFDQESQHSFWMKNTHIPLDIIWLNSNQEIVKIINAAPIDSETIYTNKDPAKYTIELPANESLKLKLQIGDTIPIFDNE